MIIESKHPYSERTHNIVEIIPNDSVFEKRSDKANQIFNDKHTERDQGFFWKQNRKSSDVNVSFRGKKKARVTKNDIKTIVKMIDRLTEGHHRVRFKDITHTYRIYKMSGSCKKEHAEGRGVSVQAKRPNKDV